MGARSIGQREQVAAGQLLEVVVVGRRADGRDGAHETGVEPADLVARVVRAERANASEPSVSSLASNGAALGAYHHTGTPSGSKNVTYRALPFEMASSV